MPVRYDRNWPEAGAGAKRPQNTARENRPIAAFGDSVPRPFRSFPCCRGARLVSKYPPPERVQVRGLRDADPGSCCLRNASAERHTTSENCRNCLARGLVLRQIMPMVREGCGFLKRATDTDAERVSTATAISGIKVTPMPAPTICTSVDRELASNTSRGGDDCI